jgi:hypothetical protein
MDYAKLLTRAFEITRKYRALWLFGILLALFGGNGRSSFNVPSNGGSSGTGTNNFNPTFPDLPRFNQEMILTLVVVFACIAIVWILLSIILRFTSRGALIGLVNELEASGTPPTVKHGFDLGFHRFWSLLGIGVTINLPITILALILLVLAAAPIVAAIPQLSQMTHSSNLPATVWAAIGGAIVLVCCVAIVMAAVSFVVHPFYQFITRTCVIKQRGVMDSLSEGYRVVMANKGKVALLYLVTIGVGIAFGIAMIPVALILLGIPAGIGIGVYVATKAIETALIVGGLIGIPMLVVLLWISGMYQVFESTFWTEGFLELTKPQEPSPAPTPTPTPAAEPSPSAV